MGWGSEWIADPQRIENFKHTDIAVMAEPLLPKWPIELKAPDTTRIYSNLKPTHDPYTNPNSLIYYECSCGAILDPGTKSFASLNNHASDKGWKIRFGETGYTPYCVRCGEGVE